MSDERDRIDEVRRRLAALDDPTALLEGLFTYAPVALQIYTSDGRSLLTNRAFRQLFGSEPPPDYIIFEDDIAAKSGIIDIIKRAFRGEVVTTDPIWYDARDLQSVEVKEGRRVAMSASFFPLYDRQGTIKHVAVVITDMTREMLALAEAQEQRARLEAVIRQMPAGVVIGEASTGEVTLANELADKLVGAVAARTAREGFPLRRALAGEAIDDEEYTVVGDDGTRKVLQVSAAPIRGSLGQVVAAVTTFFDVTERRRADEARKFLASAGHLLASSLDYAATVQTVAALAIPSLADWCAVEVVDETEGPSERAVTGDAGEAPLVLHLRVLPDVIARGQARLISEAELAGLPDIGSAMVVPLAAQGRVFGAMTLVRAAPGRYDAADLDLATELARNASLAVDNARLFRAAQDALHARATFLTIASHELKTPLAVLQLTAQSFARASARRDDPARARTAVERVTRNVERLTHIVDDLLDCSRMMAGRLQFNLDSVDLGVLAREVAARLAELAARAGSPIHIEAPEGIVGRWDRTRLDQVLTNLLANALKYGQSAPIDVIIEGDTVQAKLVVRDRGIGIDPADLSRIFQPFERAAGARYAGTGLGLWIVKQIVEALGGSIAVASTPGHGTTFTVTIPRRPMR